MVVRQVQGWQQKFVHYTSINVFQTGKTIGIADWRLSLIYWSLVAGSFIYFFFNLYESRSYLQSVDPIGKTSHWAGTSVPSKSLFNSDGMCIDHCDEVTGYYDALDKMRNWTESRDGTFAYCNNSLYDFWYSSEWIYSNISCSFPPHTQIWKKNLNTLFLQTAQEKTTERWIDAPPNNRTDSGCIAAFSALGDLCEHPPSYVAGRCMCQDKHYFFNAGAEHMSVEFDHSFTSMWAKEVKSGGGDLPKTIVREANCIETTAGSCDLMTVAAGQPFRASVHEILEKLNMKLDADACTQPHGLATNRIAETGKCPMTRLSGIQLEFALTFYNFGMEHRSGLVLNEGEPVAIIDLAPKITWNSLGNDITFTENPTWGAGSPQLNPIETVNRYRYGITISFKNGTGKIGKWDWFALINTTVQVVVLLGLSRTLTTLVARYCLGSVSKTYDASIFERMSFSRELARFTTQALIATLVLESVDSDGDMTLTTNEVKNHMSNFFKKCLGLDDVAGCAKVCMQILGADSAQETQKRLQDVEGRGLDKVHPYEGEDGEGSVNILDLIDFMTDDRLDTDSIKEEFRKRISRGKSGMSSSSSSVTES